MHNALLIDPASLTVEKITVGTSIQDIYKAIEADVFACVDLDGKNTVYVDDEALINGKSETCNSFQVETPWGLTHPIIGKALVLGFDAGTGDSKSTTLDAGLMDKIQWHI